MAEFRADKDQLRAEFALSTRRLEMNVEALRKRLAEQLRDINRKKSDLGAIKGERDNHLTIMRELEEREAELRRRMLELEKESADLAQRLRMRDREFAEKVSQLEAARDALRQKEGQAGPVRRQGSCRATTTTDIERLLADDRGRARAGAARSRTQNSMDSAARLEATERDGYAGGRDRAPSHAQERHAATRPTASWPSPKRASPTPRAALTRCSRKPPG